MSKLKLSFVLSLVLAAPHLFAQVNNASLTGLVTDSSSAVVQGARVVATNTATHAEYATTTSEGYFTLAALPIGSYEVKVEKDGFRKSVAQLSLEVGQKARQDFVLQVGAQGEQVTVESSAPLLSTEDASPGMVIENRTVTQLPLGARNWDDLMLLVPGVSAKRYTEQGGGTNSGRTGGAAVHGVRSLQNNFVLDGVDNNSFSENVQELTTQVIRPSVDAIDEFKVSTDPYSAENGRSPGAAISVTTKGGSNRFHGVGYEYLRNKIFDARDFFTARAAGTPNVNPLLKPKPQLQQNQFGGQVGGPVVKNKAFFFFNYEGTRIRKGRIYIANVPTDSERAGDFSATAATANRVAGGAYTAMIDRVGDCIGAGKAFTAANTGMPRDNMIPARCIDPIAAKILALVPHASLFPSSGPLNVSDFANVRTLRDDANNYTGRFDWNANASNSVWVRYNNVHRTRFVPGTFGGILDGTSSSANGVLLMNGEGASIGYNHVFTPTLVNELRIGWGRNWSHGAQEPFGANTLSSFGIQGVADNPLYNGGIPRMAISARGGTQGNVTNNLGGVDNWGSPDFLPKFQYTNQYQWIDTMNWTYGKHTVRFGVDARMPMRNIFLDVPQLRGQLSFDGQRTGVGFADFLLGYPQAENLSNPAVTDARIWMLSEFVQDDWKISHTLTLNLGLRYDYATWPYSGADHMTNLVKPSATAVNAIGTMMCPSSAEAICSTLPASVPTVASPVGRMVITPDRNNFAPRVGIAWQVTPKTVIRTGYGRFYLLFERAGSEDQMFLNPPWLVNASVSASSTSTTANNMRLGHPNSSGVTGFNVSLNPATINPLNVRWRAVNQNAVQPEVDQWNLGIQRELPWNVAVTADYVGTKGTHLSILRNLNQIYFDPQGRQCVTLTAGGTNCPGMAAPFIPYSNLGAIEFRDNVGNSTYHGLELSARKRFSKGLLFDMAYTWSHSIDEAPEHLSAQGSGGSFLQNEHNLAAQRGDSDFDIRQKFQMGYIYELPFGPGRSWATSGPISQLVRGWRLSGGTALQSGLPFTLLASNNNSFVQQRGGSALGNNAQASGPLLPGGLGNAPCQAVSGNLVDVPGSAGPTFFNTAAFATPVAPNPDPAIGGTVPVLGNCPRNNMRGPRYSNVDFAVARVFDYFGEGRNLEFRWEVFNALNTPQFGLPTANVNNGNFGKITSLSGDPRSMQFALRFSF